MHRTVFATVRATTATLLLGGLFSVVAFAALPSLPASAAPPMCTDQWNVTATGTYSWNTPGDWSTGSVPGTGDVACINKPGTYTVQLIGGTTTVDALVVGSGTAGDQETLQVEGTCSNNVGLDTKNTAFSPDSDAINSTGQILLGSTSLRKQRDARHRDLVDRELGRSPRGRRRRRRHATHLRQPHN